MTVNFIEVKIIWKGIIYNVDVVDDFKKRLDIKIEIHKGSKRLERQ